MIVENNPRGWQQPGWMRDVQRQQKMIDSLNVQALGSVNDLAADSRRALGGQIEQLRQQIEESERLRRHLHGPQSVAHGLDSTLRDLSEARDSLRSMAEPGSGVLDMVEQQMLRENRMMADQRRRMAMLPTPPATFDVRPTYRAENRPWTTTIPAALRRRDDVPDGSWIGKTRTFDNALDGNAGTPLPEFEAKVLSYEVFADPADDATIVYKLTLQLDSGAPISATITTRSTD